MRRFVLKVLPQWRCARKQSVDPFADEGQSVLVGEDGKALFPDRVKHPRRHQFSAQSLLQTVMYRFAQAFSLFAFRPEGSRDRGGDSRGTDHAHANPAA